MQMSRSRAGVQNNLATTFTACIWSQFGSCCKIHNVFAVKATVYSLSNNAAVWCRSAQWSREPCIIDATWQHERNRKTAESGRLVSTNTVQGRVICSLVIGGRRSTTRSAAANAAVISAVCMCGLIKQSKQTAIGGGPQYDTGNIQLPSMTARSHYGWGNAFRRSSTFCEHTLWNSVISLNTFGPLSTLMNAVRCRCGVSALHSLTYIGREAAGAPGAIASAVLKQRVLFWDIIYLFIQFIRPQHEIVGL